jgi:hypothetical protein
MSFLRFCGHFAAAYGTRWLALVFPALFGGTFHIGEFGIYGFLAVSLGYAAIRIINDKINRLHPTQE